MRELKKEEKEFLERVLKSHLHKRGSYWAFTFRDKHYRRSRVLMQLH